MHWKSFSRKEVTVCLKAEPEFVPVEGNVSASGDDAFDREVEHNIMPSVGLCRIGSMPKVGSQWICTGNTGDRSDLRFQMPV